MVDRFRIVIAEDFSAENLCLWRPLFGRGHERIEEIGIDGGVIVEEKNPFGMFAQEPTRCLRCCLRQSRDLRLFLGWA